MNTSKMRFTLLLITIMNSYAWKVMAQSKAEKTENTFEEGQQKHLVLTQYYRWFQAFERELTDARIQNHLAILSDSVLITTNNGPLRGKEGMLGFLNYVSSWKNSHHIEAVNVTSNNDGTLSLEADILYQNILPDGKQNAYKLHYTTRLKEIENDLPVFTEIELLPTETLENPTFEDAYVENRSKSSMYYWLYLMENWRGNETRFKELLAPDFRLILPAGDITDYRQFEAWVQKEQGKFTSTLHSVKNFKSEYNTDQTISVSLDIEWQGIGVKGEKMTGETHNEWILENNPDERFARLKEMKTTQIKPLQVVKDF